MGSVSTLWLVLDLGRRRPVRLPESVTARMGELSIGENPARSADLESPAAAERELRFTVRRSDLDLAGHVNNTSYVGWAVEAVDDTVWEACDLSFLDIQVLSECRHGQTVVSGCQTEAIDGGFECRHRIVREDDGTETARARTMWRIR
jgi:acyl-CoA thioesterase FadM